jgi:hypothetical protein
MNWSHGPHMNSLRILPEAAKVIYKTYKRNPPHLRYSFSWYDASWKTVPTIASCTLPLDDLRATHFRHGPINLKQTPHFEHFSQLLSSKPNALQFGRSTYAEYMIDQYGYSEAELEQRLERNKQLFLSYLAGSSFTILVQPARSNLWTIYDGFHRAALVLAVGLEDTVRVRVAI